MVLIQRIYLHLPFQVPYRGRCLPLSKHQLLLPEAIPEDVSVADCLPSPHYVVGTAAHVSKAGCPLHWPSAVPPVMQFSDASFGG